MKRKLSDRGLCTLFVICVVITCVIAIGLINAYQQQSTKQWINDMEVVNYD